MEQQLARTRLGMTELARRGIGADVDALQRGLAIFDAHVSVAQVRAMRSQRLHLGAQQREAGLEGLLDEEVVARLAIIDDQLEAVILSRGGLGAWWFCRSFCH